MKNLICRCSKFKLILLVVMVALSLIYWMGRNGLVRPTVVEAKITKETPVYDETNPKIRAAMAAQHRHNPQLFAIPEVVGTATGLSEVGPPAVHVFLKKTVRPGVIPGSLDGIPVVLTITGEFFAMKKPFPAGSVKPAGWFTRPVPIGVSTGNADECSAGTIAARVKDSTGNVYALSNNHVYALENVAPIGSQVLQPGLYDTKCGIYQDQDIGTLSNFVTIVFSTSASNTVDAAIALSSTADLGNATPPRGYGMPNSATAAPYVGQLIQKYGRTTSITTGTITGINATVNVGYSSGTARFINQIFVYSSRPFIKAGDSGSLLVTNDSNANPVGLLFAGNSSGTFAVANPIDLVLNGLHVAIDGK